MAESSVPVDLLNPGQVFACLGVLEATEILLGDAVAGFDWHTSAQATFRVSAAGEKPPMDEVISFLEEAEITARAPAASPNLDAWKAIWGQPPRVDDDGEPFPFPDPTSPATLPVVLRGAAGRQIPIEYWGDATRRDNVKFWAGAAGRPGAALLRDALSIVRGKMRQHATDPFALSGVQTNSFRFDWRRDYVPVQEGFSPNNHKKGSVEMIGFPLVEILAAIGVSHARPKRINKLKYRYGVLGGSALMSPVFHRVALGADVSPVPGAMFRRFAMELDWPGKENQIRCIAQVREEGDRPE